MPEDTSVSLSDYVHEEDGDWGTHGPNDALNFDALRELVIRKADRESPKTGTSTGTGGVIHIN